LSDAPHTLTIFDDELDQLRAMVSQMGGKAETALADAVEALVSGDLDRARGVVAGDAGLDALGREIERHAVRTIALRAPLADDLREILAALKIAARIERIGDSATAIAERTALVRDPALLAELRLVEPMAEAASRMLTGALDCFVKRDPAAAILIPDGEREVGQYHDCLFAALIARMTKRPRVIGPGTELIFISRKLERVADHARGIAEIVHEAGIGGEPPGLATDAVSGRSTARQ
jgi:phosphate transport system protein